MRRVFARENWDEKLHNKTAEQAWAALRNKVDELVRLHVPQRRRRNYNKPPWLNREILRAIRRKKKIWRTAKQG
jgi:hypothetical protein